jgi:PAS domain S-box-containing protein
VTIFRSVFENLLFAGIIFNDRGVIIEANSKFCRLSGYVKPRVVGADLKDFFHPEDFSAYLNHLELLRKGETEKYRTQRYLLSQKGQSIRVLESTTVINKNQIEGSNFVSILEESSGADSTKNVFPDNFNESICFQLQKLETAGSFARVVTHDLKNLMTVVISFSDILLTGLDEKDSMRADLINIKKAGKRAADLTKMLSVFGQNQIIKILIIDLNSLIRCNEGFIQKLMGERVTTTLCLNPDLWRIKADFSQMELVLFNLVINAKDAMPGGGKLEIKTENITIENNADSKGHPVKPGKYVKWTISDTGHGMDPDTLSQIFEPFFTTKIGGKGTGLGLTITYSIISKNKGSVSVQSEPGRGSIFTLFLPRSSGIESGQNKTINFISE